jgi:hypothetical protein
MQRNFRANAKPPEPKDDLLIYKKMREMMQYGNNVLNNGQFPKKYRIGNGIGAQIERSMFEAMRLINRALTKEHKKAVLEEADAELKNLRQLILIASDPKYDGRTILISQKQQMRWSAQLIEIGKLIGSWLGKLK